MQNNQTAPVPRVRISPAIGLIATLIIAAAAYWPGLSGGYLFDDWPNIVDNHDLQISSLSMSDLAHAALSSPASEFRRPLASLSFAANFYLTGLDPFWMKLTNLLIHLFNGVLVYLLALSLISATRRNCAAPDPRDPRWIALLIAAGWLLLPINLTGVLYVVQRMESLANLFVLLGLLGYMHARERMIRDGQGFFMAVSSIIAASAFGLLAKETAVMTPLYAVLIEWAVFNTRSRDVRRDPRIIGLFLVVLAVPLVGGLIWQLPRLLTSTTWASRNFDLYQRLLTETRVVVDYIEWTILPTPQALSFYHDDYPVSIGWLHPWTTLASALALAALVIAAIKLRKSMPLAALGISLFLGAQLLTCTILPLELVYEHRNYFASFGLLLALISLLSASAKQLPIPTARYILMGGLLTLWLAVTASNASAWGSPITLAQTLAERAPNSIRAQYGLGYTYVVLSKYDPKSPFTKAAYAPLEKAMHMPGNSIVAEHALIIMNACCLHQPVKDEWWDSLISKLKAQKPGAQDEGALESLVDCASKKDCPLDPDKMMQAFMAALSHTPPRPRLLGVYGYYAWNVLGDRTLGESMLADASHAAPNDAAYRLGWINMLIKQGRFKDAKREISYLESINYMGRLDGNIAKLRDMLATAEKRSKG